MDSSLVQLALFGFGAVFGIIYTCAAAVSLRWVRLGVTLCLVLSSLMIHTTWDGYVYRTWLLPVQQYRSWLVLALCVSLALATAIHRPRSPRMVITTQTWILLLIALYAGGLRFYHESVMDGIISLVSAALLIPTITYVTFVCFPTTDELYRMPRLLVWFGLIWVALTAVQLVLNPSLVMTTHPIRFIGMSGNAQKTAISLAPCCVASVWLMLNDRDPKLRKLWPIVGAGFGCLLLLTGSRTGFGMMVLGTMLVSYRRLGRVVILLPVLGILLLVGLKLVSMLGLSESAGRVLSTQNTRAEGWRALFRNGMSNPYIGIGQTAAEASENSLLYGFASYGVGMVFLMLLFMLTSGLLIARLNWTRKRLDPSIAPLCDMCIAYNAIYLLSSVSEGILLARVEVNLILMLMFASTSALLLRLRNVELGEGEWAWGEYESLSDEPRGSPVGEWSS